MSPYQDLFFITNSIASIVFVLFLVTLGWVMLSLAQDLKRILEKIDWLASRGIAVSETTGFFLSNLIDRIKRL